MWIPDFMMDIESDMSRFHRVVDVRTMDGPRFFSFANRLHRYDGAVRAARLESEQSVDSSISYPEPIAQPMPVLEETGYERSIAFMARHGDEIEMKRVSA